MSALKAQFYQEADAFEAPVVDVATNYLPTPTATPRALLSVDENLYQPFEEGGESAAYENLGLEDDVPHDNRRWD